MIDVEVDDPSWTEALPEAAAVVEQAAAAALEAALIRVIPDGRQGRSGTQGIEPGVLMGPGATPGSRPGFGRDDGEELGSLVILLADDDTVQDLNHRFRRKDAATNVLSFPAAPNPADHLGDIALAFGVCAAEAKLQGKTLADHLRHLTIHGVLHLLGYDHQIDSEAEAMEAMERRILQGLGVADPYGAEGDAD